MAFPMVQSDPTAVVGRRILAFGIDLLLVTGVLMAVLLPAWNARAESFPASRFRCPDELQQTSRESVPDDGGLCLEAGSEIQVITESEAQSLSLMFYGVFGLFGLLDLVVLQGLTGASVGKLITGLRVVRPDGSKAGIGWAALRWVLLFVDALCCFLPGAVLVFSTKGHRRIGDMAASTFVVARAQVGTPVVVPGMAPVAATGVPPSYPGYPGYPSGPAGPAGPGYGVGAPPAPGGFPSYPAPTGPQLPPAGAPEGDGPHWDQARDTYIQYDRELAAWMEWDATSSRWRPIDSDGESL